MAINQSLDIGISNAQIISPDRASPQCRMAQQSLNAKYCPVLISRPVVVPRPILPNEQVPLGPTVMTEATYKPAGYKSAAPLSASCTA